MGLVTRSIPVLPVKNCSGVNAGGDVVRTLDEVDLQPLHALSRRLIRRGRDLVSRGGSYASRRDDEILRAQSGTSDAEFPRPADGERGALER